MTGDRDDMAERIRATLNPEPDCADWPNGGRLALHLPEPWTPRDPSQPVETFRMRYRRPDPERSACRVRWALRIALATAGVLVMYCEGRHQPAPGVGFAIALALLGAAALIGGSKR